MHEKKPHSSHAIFTIFLGSIFLILSAIFFFRMMAPRPILPPPPSSRAVDVSTIRGWMTIGYVAKIYGVPAPVIAKELGVSIGEYSHESIDAIAKQLDRDQDQFVLDVQRAVEKNRR